MGKTQGQLQNGNLADELSLYSQAARVQQSGATLDKLSEEVDAPTLTRPSTTHLDYNAVGRLARILAEIARNPVVAQDQ